MLPFAKTRLLCSSQGIALAKVINAAAIRLRTNVDGLVDGRYLLMVPEINDAGQTVDGGADQIGFAGRTSRDEMSIDDGVATDRGAK